MNITVFDFVESEAGPYGEVVISLVVIPWASRDQELPHSAFFPIFLATTTYASRAHASERWKLPEYEHRVEVSHLEEANRPWPRGTGR